MFTGEIRKTEVTSYLCQLLLYIELSYVRIATYILLAVLCHTIQLIKGTLIK